MYYAITRIDVMSNSHKNIILKWEIFIYFIIIAAMIITKKWKMRSPSLLLLTKVSTDIS